MRDLSRNITFTVLGSLVWLSGLVAAEADKLDFEIVYTATINNIPESAGLARIWIPYPTSDEYQQIHSIKTSSPYATYIFQEEEYENNFLYLEVKNPTIQKLEITMQILASREREVHKISWNQIGELSEAERQQFEKYFRNTLDPSTREKIKAIVRDYVDNQPSYIDKVRAIFDYVYDNMEYRKDIPGYGKGDVARACKVRAGNCVDFHSLFVAIAQEAGIVATEVANIDLPFEEGMPNYCDANYHCNVEVYLPNYGWFPLDVSHARKGKGSKEFYFGSLDNLRLKIGRGRNVRLAPEQDGDRLERVLHRPYVEIDGLSHEDVEVSVLAATYEATDIADRRPHLIAAGEKAEPFKWTDINGKTVNMVDYLGRKPILINFFSTWCGRCNWETDGLNRAYSDFSEFEFFRIDLMEKPRKVLEFAREHKIAYPVLADEKGELARLYGIKYVPTNIVIDREGIVRFSGGLLSEGDLRQRLMEVLAASEVL